MNRNLLILLIISLLGMTGAAVTSGAAPQEVNLYSYRQPFLINPVLDEFTRRTGIKVNVVYAKKGMLEKLKAAGANTPADAVLTVDIGRLNELKKAGLLQPIHSAVLKNNIPAHLRHPDGLWFGLTTRARIALVSKNRVRPDALKTYADLADPKFRGRICMRSGKHPYNVALIASVIAHEGEEEAEKWLRGVKANLARKPQGNDRAQAKAIYEGVCDIGIANTYYMGKMATNEKKPEQKKWAEAVRVVFSLVADPKFRGRICMRSGKHPYNVALIASVIAHEGEEEAEKWLRGVKANLARKPQGNDRAQAKAIYEGVCDIGIANTYYMGKMATNEKKPEQKKWAEAVRVVFLNQDGRGNHINISGAAVTRNAKNQAHAVKLIEFLSGDFAQQIYASQNFEYPAKAGVAIDPLVRSWGDFKADTVSLEKIATLRATASRLVDKVRFNEGPGS